MIALTAERGTTSESFGLAVRAVCNTKAPRQRIDRCDARVQDRVSQEGVVATRYSVRSVSFRLHHQSSQTTTADRNLQRPPVKRDSSRNQ